MIEYTFDTDTIGFQNIADITWWVYLNGERTIWDLVVEDPTYTFILWKVKEGPFLTQLQNENTISQEFAFEVYEIIKQN